MEKNSGFCYIYYLWSIYELVLFLFDNLVDSSEKVGLYEQAKSPETNASVKGLRIREIILPCVQDVPVFLSCVFII